MVTFRPAAPELRDLFRLEVHDAVFQALVEEGAVVDGYLDPEQLERWAAQCDNPSGQRASMARALAQLRRVAPLSFG